MPVNPSNSGELVKEWMRTTQTESNMLHRINRIHLANLADRYRVEYHPQSCVPITAFAFSLEHLHGWYSVSYYGRVR
jgi:hypothetical protein